VVREFKVFLAEITACKENGVCAEISFYNPTLLHGSGLFLNLFQ